MKKMMTVGVALLLAVTGRGLAAQTKTITGETKTMTAVVESIERSSRAVTVKKADGKYEVFYVPEDVKRFDTLKIGDKVSARYYENMVLQLKAPGAKPTDEASAAVTKAKDGKSATTVAHQRTITATITEIDQKVPSITFSGPNGWTYSTKVLDKAALAKVKVGDKVDITWTEAMILSLEDGK